MSQSPEGVVHPGTTPHQPVPDLPRLTGAQRRLLEHVAANPGRLFGSRRDIPPSIARRDVIDRATFQLGLLEVPRCTPTRTWELTPTGRAALDAARTALNADEGPGRDKP